MLLSQVILIMPTCDKLMGIISYILTILSDNYNTFMIAHTF